MKIITFACGAQLKTNGGTVPGSLCVWTNQPGVKIDRPVRGDGKKAACLFGCDEDDSESGRTHHRCVTDEGLPYFVVICRPMNATQEGCAQ